MGYADPIPYSKEVLTQAINLNPEEISFDTLQRFFGLNSTNNYRLHADLQDLVRGRDIRRIDTTRFSSTAPLSDVMYARVQGETEKGRIALKPDGVDEDFPFTVSLTKKEARKHILKRGDRVLVHTTRFNGTRLHAKVLAKVNFKSKPLLTGTFTSAANFKPTDKTIKTVFKATGNVPEAITPGKVYIAVIPGTIDPYSPEVFIDSQRWEPETGTKLSHIIADKHKLKIRHSPEAERLAKKIVGKKFALEDRRDLSDIPFLVVDPADSPGDYDDAVYAERMPNGGYRQIVAISDVASLVPKNSQIEIEAMERCTSYYFPEEREFFHMLPPVLSLHRAALKQGSARPVIYNEQFRAADGTLLDSFIGRGYIRNHRNMTYERFQAFLNEYSGESQPYRELSDIFWQLNIRKRLHFKRTNESQRIAQAKALIEDFAIETNAAKARFLEETPEALCLRRAHSGPINNLAFETATDQLRAWGYDAPYDIEEYTTELLNEILDEAWRKKEGEMVAEYIKHNILTRATTSLRPIGHFGLSQNTYGFFTSPLRRLEDLINQRLLYRAWGNHDIGLNDENTERLQKIVDHINRTASVSASVEKDSFNYFKIRDLQRHEGNRIIAELHAIHDNGDIDFILKETGLRTTVLAKDIPPEYRITPNRAGLTYEGRQWLPLGSSFRLGIGKVEPHRGLWSVTSIEHRNNRHLKQAPANHPGLRLVAA